MSQMRMIFRLISRLPLKQVGQSIRTMNSSSAKRLAGKVAIITASTDGIGYSIAERLGQDGVKVMISSRKQKNVDSSLQKLKSLGIEASGLVCHVAKREDRAKMIQKTLDDFGGIDIFVSNAAANPHFGPLLSCSEEAWDKIFETNVKATFMLCKEIIPHMEKRGGGSIVIVSSIGGYQPSPVIGAYSVSKTALLGLTKALVHECSPRNIRVNGIAPGVIKTRFSEQLWKDEESTISQMAKNMTPMKRFGEPKECAGTVSFLVSDDASYITGETILVTGGIDARL
ncbi:dehydrogenase/reductase SDR family member 4-like [Saccostrea echinata]|uniref:dehydrogenase/reductase SDR family member 4-like n=1 Tax=Saccostrea echinata TaxID=191078 RepID=UPI002A837A61|nr:dehydrogenase/reductase SDR family member 4-like [Saccostrea echinata]